MMECNNCAICLEPLINSEQRVGTSVPCGHCFHEECFEEWKKSRSNLFREDVRCPMCSVETTSFVKIFIKSACDTEGSNKADCSCATAEDSTRKTDSCEKKRRLEAKSARALKRYKRSYKQMYLKYSSKKQAWSEEKTELSEQNEILVDKINSMDMELQEYKDALKQHQGQIAALMEQQESQTNRAVKATSNSPALNVHKRDMLISSIVVKYLERKDPASFEKAKAVIKDCRKRMRKQAYESGGSIIRAKLKQAMSESTWKGAKLYVKQILAKNRKNRRSS